MMYSKKTLRNNFTAPVFLLVAISVCCTTMFCNVKTNVPAQSVTTYAGLNDTVQYVGMQTCKQCHAAIYNTFIETGMGQSFDVASKQKSSADFAHATIYDKHSDLYYHAAWQNNYLMFSEYRLQQHDTIHAHKQLINYIVGSGQHTNSHIYNNNGYLYQAPMTYYTQKGIWDLPPSFENGNNTRFSRAIGQECITCHNAYPTMQMGSENKYSFVANGIDCERCHGPGAAHVQHIQAGHLTDTANAIDYSIVNPAKLPINLQLDVCQRCHIQGNAVLKPGKSFFDFKPGISLSSVMDVYMPVYTGQETEHIMASHAERLKMSQCYINTSEQISNNTAKLQALRPYKNALTCITCHNPHVSVKVTGKEIYNRACVNCHQSNGHKLCTAPTVKLNAAKNNCIQCHMPKSGAIDIPHVRVTDHYIAKPVPAKEVQKIKQFIGLACINNNHADSLSMAMAYINYYEKFTNETFALDSAARYLPDNNVNPNNFNQLIHLAYLRSDYQKVLSYNRMVGNSLSILNQQSYTNTHAWTCYRISESFWQL
ncbi:MAG TPA: cytochrome c3 family protein, partial [Bacteroidia bacterium]|nr:cytochrome c3 family protein [Bacteroidia bacterium]